jgi:solute carrier family 8 (sodium/calcium exchanger)
MAAIEVITAAEGTRKFKQANGTVVEYAYKLVNPTVANLTLMALGSSAPEILLAIIGTIQTLDTMPDELGPSTIVGSAAFNLLMITAICMSALPGGQTKKINDLAVYAVTATFSLVAYIWLYIVLAVVSPDVVEIWEAFVTLGLFGAMLSIAYVVDVRGKCCRPPRDETDVDQARRDSDPQLSKDGLMEELHQTRQLNNQRSMASCSTLAQSAEPSTGYPQNHTGFMRGLTGQRRLVEHVSTTEGFQPSEQLDGSQRGGSQRGGSQRSTHPEAGARASVTTGNASLGVVTPAQTKPFSASSAAMLAKADESVLHIAQFGAAQYVVREDWQHATCVITLEPACSDRRVVVSWRAVSHDSECDDELFDAAAQPFVGASGMAVFEPGVRSVAVAVELAPSAIPADDCALFSLVATRAWVEPSKGVAPQPSARETSMRAQANAILGARTRTEVKAYGKRSPLQPAHGQLRFSAAKVVCEECCGTVEVIVTRVNGLDGTISCLFATRDGSAKAGSDYVHQEGALVFLPGEREKAIVLDIIDDDVEEDTEAFTVELLPTDVVTIRGPSEASGAGVVLASESVCVIEIIDDDSWKVRMRTCTRASSRGVLRGRYAMASRARDYDLNPAPSPCTLPPLPARCCVSAIHRHPPCLANPAGPHAAHEGCPAQRTRAKVPCPRQMVGPLQGGCRAERRCRRGDRRGAARGCR